MAKNLHAKSFGKWGEEKATIYYQQLGFEIIARNVHTPYGEIDLIVKDQTGIIFVEVKTRSSMSFGYPQESITKLKQEHMIKSADAFLQEHPEFEDHWTIDVLSIQKLTGTNEIYFERFENAIN
jgi:putative endonuclease